MRVESLPVVTEIDPYGVVADLRTIAITTTVDWIKIPRLVTAEALERDWPLWLDMHFEDWRGVPPDVRAIGMRRMVQRYGDVLNDPAEWSSMRADHWDAVPQPIESAAVLNMIRYWARHYDPADGFDLTPARVLHTMQALAMVESWFFHRAVNRNRDGTVDIGIGQTSAYARERIRTLARQGLADFAPSDDEYYDPFVATRALVFWFGLMLDEAGGDLDLAVRAYHRGIGSALEGGAEEYLHNVHRKRLQYILGEGAPPAWRALQDAITAAESTMTTARGRS